MSTEASAIRKELELLAKRGRGVLKPEAVVEFARDSSTALHSQFNWDDTEAAQLYRLHQARNILRVQVTYEPRTEKKMNIFVSLPSDREEDGGGYRRMVDVLSDADRRQQLLAMAIDELAVFQKKYATLEELAEVFMAASKVSAKKMKTNKKQGRAIISKSA